jgi:malonate transporter and related proteins
MNHPVLNALLPVVLLIAIGFVSGRTKIIRASGVKDLSNLVFMVVLPALLFRTMAQVHPEAVNGASLLTYFGALWLLFGATMAVVGFTRRGAVLALATTFSNSVMMGIALIGIAYGTAGQAGAATAPLQRPPVWRTVGQAARNAIIHPVPLPIICGLLFAQTGLSLPQMIDTPMQLLGQSFSPLALILVGITLAQGAPLRHLRSALWITAAKNLLLPAMVAALGWALGLRGLPLSVVIVTASLPIGANVFLFSQRYQVAEELVTASMAVSTVLALPSVALVMWLVQYL